jgi:hypothetical protein
MKKEKQKTFYIVSSLSRNESWAELHRRKKYETEEAASDAACEIIKNRRESGARDLSFFVLKAVALVGPVQAPIEVTRLK